LIESTSFRVIGVPIFAANWNADYADARGLAGIFRDVILNFHFEQNKKSLGFKHLRSTNFVY